ANILNEPLKLPCGAQLPNRLCKAALTEGLADEYNRATIRHERLYTRWSLGGAGLVLTGNVTVDRKHPERANNVAIDNNGGFSRLEAYARAGTIAGNHLWMQLTHAGRQTPYLVNPEPLAPSATPIGEIAKAKKYMYGAPRAMTEAEILDV